SSSPIYFWSALSGYQINSQYEAVTGHFVSDKYLMEQLRAQTIPLVEMLILWSLESSQIVVSRHRQMIRFRKLRFNRFFQVPKYKNTVHVWPLGLAATV